MRVYECEQSLQQLFSLPAVPGAPAPPTISDVFSSTATLSWSAPAKDGGAPITGYHVERRSSTAKRWVFVSTEPIKETTAVMRDLFAETEYEFRVSAENKVGTGSPSQPAGPITTKDPWGEYRRTTNLILNLSHS